MKTTLKEGKFIVTSSQDELAEQTDNIIAYLIDNNPDMTISYHHTNYWLNENENFTESSVEENMWIYQKKRDKYQKRANDDMVDSTEEVVVAYKEISQNATEDMTLYDFEKAFEEVSVTVMISNEAISNSDPSMIVEFDLAGDNEVKVQTNFERLFLQGYNDRILTTANGQDNSTYTVSSGLLNKIYAN